MDEKLQRLKRRYLASGNPKDAVEFTNELLRTQENTHVAFGAHPSHKTRFASGASTYDEICNLCGATDEVPGGWGRLAYPCPKNTTKALGDSEVI